MTAEDRSATIAPAPSGRIGTQVLVIGALALVLNYAVIIAQMHGYAIFIPIEIFAGFSFRVAPLLPLAAALVLAYGLWRYSGLSQAKAWLAVLCLFLAPILFGQIWNALNGLVMSHLPDSVVSNSQNFYGVLFGKGVVSAASVLLVLAIADRGFRDWRVWLYLIVIWAGGDTLLFGLYRNSLISMPAYQYLYPLERTLGFLVLACYYHGAPAAA